MPKFYGRIEKIEDYFIEARSVAEAKAFMRRIVNGEDVEGKGQRFTDQDHVERWELCRTDQRGDPTDVIDGEGTRVVAWDTDMFGKPVRRHCD